MSIVLKILPYIINIVSALVIATCTYHINKVRKDREDENKKAQAIEDGVQCLLRNSIVSDYNKYTNKGYCPIYAKESLKRTYEAYKNLDGNDVATELYQALLHLPTEVTDNGKGVHEKVV